MWGLYNFPVFLLCESSTQSLHEIALKNENNDSYPTKVTEFDLVMQTTKAGTHDSESCLREGSCLPLGGYSVLPSLPTTKVDQPIVLTVASMDSASFFRDKSFGAQSPLSGLISMLAAIDAFSHIEDLNTLSKQLVFVVFTGEAWVYLGSRIFLLDDVNGINKTLIETVIEVGSVRKGYDDDGVKTEC